MKIIERTHNIQTGEIVDIERDETEQEIAIREELQAEKAILQAEQDALLAQRLAVFERLGLTEEEAKLLLS